MTHDDLYVALGDSTGVGLGALHGGYPQRLLGRLRALRPAFRLLNLSQSGARSLDVLESQVPDALKLRPALFTIAVGINDVTHDEPEEAFTNNLEEIAVRLSGRGARIAIATIPDIAFAPAVRALVPPAYFERRIEVLNRHVEATAARHRFALIDLYALGRAELEKHPEYFCGDGFHPSDAGYEAWTDIAWPAIRELMVDAHGTVGSARPGGQG